MYAILETGGKQYRVEQGDTIYVEKLPYEELEIVELDKIVAVGKDDGIVVGKPLCGRCNRDRKDCEKRQVQKDHRIYLQIEEIF